MIGLRRRFEFVHGRFVRGQLSLNLGALIAALTLLAVISVQYRVQVFLLHHAQWQTVVQNKFLLILLLRQQNLELLILFCLYLGVIVSTRSPRSAAAESYAACQSAIPLHR